MMFMYSPNLWLVLAAAVVGLVVGAVWYSGRVLGPLWSSLTGRSAQMTRNGRIALAAVLLVESYITAHFVYYVGAYSWLEGAQAGLWLWLGFVATTLAASALMGGQRFKLWLIDAGYQLLFLLIIGAIFASW